MAYQLKCKAIALAVEAQAFKKQEQRLKKWKMRAEAGKAKAQRVLNKKYDPETLQGIHLHRIRDIRKEARNAVLAYGFTRGRSYHEMERFAWTQPNWDRIEKLAVRYSKGSEQDVKQSFAQWRDEALNGCDPKWKESLVPGTVKDAMYDTDWVNMQLYRNAGKTDWPGKGSVLVIESADEDQQKVSLTQRIKNLFGK